MRRKIVVVWISLTMVFGFIAIVDITMDFIPGVKGATLYVNETGSGGVYTSIQDAINDSKDGDTVYVYSGTYIENVIVNRSINLTGEDRDTTTINGGGSGDVILVESHWTNITGFTVTNGRYGIFLYLSSNHMIEFNNVTNNNIGINLWTSSDNHIKKNLVSLNNNWYGILLGLSSNNNIFLENSIIQNFDGIVLDSSSNNRIIKNNIKSNKGAGITLDTSSNNNEINGNNVSWSWGYGVHLSSSSNDNIIIENNIFNNADGIRLTSSSRNTIAGNNVSSNNWNGILLDSSSLNIIKMNTISMNKFAGIRFSSSSNNDITGNRITLNTDEGILLDVSSTNTIIGNTVLNNYYGIYLYYSNVNYILGNNVSSNNYIGIYLTNSNNNHIYHNNIIDNVDQAYDDFANNYWDNGYPSGGNYWSDYTGIDLNSTPSQDVPPPDGIGDVPYVIDLDSQDYYPFMDPVNNSMYLYEGWNLISIPLIQSETNIGTVLSSISGSYDAVQWYNISDSTDPWKHNKIGKPLGNDLFNLNETMSFWIHITQPGETIFLYNGTQPTSNQTIQLHSGWNMVGYPSLTSYNRTTGLNNLTFDTHVDAIQWYDTATKTWHFMDQDDSFVPGRGYWVHSKVEAEWEVPL